MPALDADGSVFIAYRNPTIPTTLNSIDALGNLRWSGHLGGTLSEAAAIGSDGTIYLGGNISGKGKDAGEYMFAFGPGTP